MEKIKKTEKSGKNSGNEFEDHYRKSTAELQRKNTAYQTTLQMH